LGLTFVRTYVRTFVTVLGERQMIKTSGQGEVKPLKRLKRGGQGCEGGHGDATLQATCPAGIISNKWTVYVEEAAYVNPIAIQELAQSQRCDD